jgi:hypothetical protein
MLFEQRAINAKVAEAMEQNAKVNEVLAKQMTGLRATIQGAQRVIREEVAGQIERGREHDRIARETGQLLRDAQPEVPTDG